MRYSTEPKYSKYVQRYDFLSFAKKCGNKYGKELMDAETKARIDAAKTVFKTVVQKAGKATWDLIGNKMADKITSVGKTKSKDKKDETNKRQEIYIPT